MTKERAKIPSFIIDELITRISFLERIPLVESYLSLSNGAVLKIAEGHLFIPLNLIVKQIETPELITREELFSIIRSRRAAHSTEGFNGIFKK